MKADGSGGGTKVVPTGNVGVFDGKNLHIRLKCPARFKPTCQTSAVPVSKKVRGAMMASQLKRTIRSGKWTNVSFLIKPKFRPKVQAMTKKSTKQLVVRQKIRSKKLGKRKFRGKPQTVFHRYTVRSSG